MLQLVTVCLQARAFAFKQLGEKPPPSGSSGGQAGGGGSCGGGGGGGAGAGTGDGDSFYKGTDVVTLTDGNFQEEVMDSEDIWFVEVSRAVQLLGVLLLV
jgi:hypothetical protein